MLRPYFVAAALVALIATAPAARAASGPLFQVPGAISGGGLGTIISCTNTGAVAEDVTVEWFDKNGTASGTAVPLTVNPRQTQVFGSTNFAGFVVDNVAGANFFRGSAHIHSTEKTLACSALVADTGNTPPTSMASLTIITKTKQHGD